MTTFRLRRLMAAFDALFLRTTLHRNTLPW